MNFTPFEKSIHDRTEQLIRQEFPVSANRFFHCSSEATIAVIVNTQTFWASFIRSTSDSLEFSAPMAACRDAICIKNQVFQFQKFPIKLFQHFNEEACEPTARPYFISLSGNRQSSHLQAMYGAFNCEFELTSGSPEFQGNGYFIGIKYVSDIKAEAFRLLNEWRDKVLQTSLSDHGIKDGLSRMNEWFYTMMLFCNSISLGIKEDAFAQEEETRIVVFPKDPDAVTPWHDKRGVRPLQKKSLVNREYLPIKFNALGIVAKP